MADGVWLELKEGEIHGAPWLLTDGVWLGEAALELNAGVTDKEAECQLIEGPWLGTAIDEGLVEKVRVGLEY